MRGVPSNDNDTHLSVSSLLFSFLHMPSLCGNRKFDGKSGAQLVVVEVIIKEERKVFDPTNLVVGSPRGAIVLAGASRISV